ncbi:MAG: DUF4199 domain-containing protein [Bacteroidales bacterium]|nr:DUF4199 domain-containing protein [Bacteroidales bacterium]
MKTTQRSLVAHSLIYGLILGAVMIVVSLIYYILDVNMFTIGFGILSVVVSLAIVIIVFALGMNSYRDRYLGGKIDFKRCFLIGLIIGLVGFIISAAYNLIFMTYIEPGAMEEGVNKVIEKWGDKMTEEQLDDMISKMQKRMTPSAQIKSSLITGAIISALLSLIVSAFIKKDKTVSEGI